MDRNEHTPSLWILLASRNFLILMAGQNLSSWGDAIFSIALVWFVYQDTHSTLGTAAVSAAQRLAATLSGPAAGVFVDRWDRRRTMMGTNLVSTGVVLLTAMLTFRHVLGVWAIYAALFALTAAAMVERPAFHSVMRRILPHDQLAAGNGLYQSVGAANGFVAASVGGLVVAAAGAVVSGLLDVASFAFSVAALAMLRLSPESSPPSGSDTRAGQHSFWGELREGWVGIQQQPALKAIAVWAFVGTAGGGAVLALLPVVVFRNLSGGPAALGLVDAGAVLGSVAGGLATGWAARRIAMARLMMATSAVAGCAMAAFGLSHALVLSVGLYALAGFGQTVGSAAFSALFQASVPSSLMGRTFGILGAIEGAAGPVTALAGGMAASVAGAGVTMAAGGLWMALSGLLLLKSRPLMTLGASAPDADRPSPTG